MPGDVIVRRGRGGRAQVVILRHRHKLLFVVSRQRQRRVVVEHAGAGVGPGGRRTQAGAASGARGAAGRHRTEALGCHVIFVANRRVLELLCARTTRVSDEAASSGEPQIRARSATLPARAGATPRRGAKRGGAHRRQAAGSRKRRS